MNKRTNKEFASTDECFARACALSRTSPTKRQASKYHLGKGRAIEYKTRAVQELAREREEAK